jgi:hypothetical protein
MTASMHPLQTERSEPPHTASAPERLEPEQRAALLEMAVAAEHQLIALRMEIAGLDEDAARIASARRMALKIQKLRHRVRAHVGPSYIQDPVFDLMIDIFINQVAHRPVSVSAVSNGTGVAATTSLRWIARLCEKGILVRTDDPFDHRRGWLTLSDRSFSELVAILVQTAKG